MTDDSHMGRIKANVIRADVLMADTITRGALVPSAARWFRVTTRDPGRAVCVEYWPGNDETAPGTST